MAAASTGGDERREPIFLQTIKLPEFERAVLLRGTPRDPRRIKT